MQLPPEGRTFSPSARAHSGLAGACQGHACDAEPQRSGSRRAPVESDARGHRALSAGPQQRHWWALRQRDEMQLWRTPPVRQAQAAPCCLRPACALARCLSDKSPKAESHEHHRPSCCAGQQSPSLTGHSASQGSGGCLHGLSGDLRRQRDRQRIHVERLVQER